MAECLAGEVIDAANGLGASIKRRDDMQKMAESNRAFAHYAGKSGVTRSLAALALSVPPS